MVAFSARLPSDSSPLLNHSEMNDNTVVNANRSFVDPSIFDLYLFSLGFTTHFIGMLVLAVWKLFLLCFAVSCAKVVGMVAAPHADVYPRATLYVNAGVPIDFLIAALLKRSTLVRREERKEKTRRDVRKKLNNSRDDLNNALRDGHKRVVNFGDLVSPPFAMKWVSLAFFLHCSAMACFVLLKLLPFCPVHDDVHPHTTHDCIEAGVAVVFLIALALKKYRRVQRDLKKEKAFIQDQRDVSCVQEGLNRAGESQLVVVNRPETSYPNHFETTWTTLGFTVHWIAMSAFVILKIAVIFLGDDMHPITRAYMDFAIAVAYLIALARKRHELVEREKLKKCAFTHEQEDLDAVEKECGDLQSAQGWETV